MAVQYHDDISLTTFRKDFDKYSWNSFRHDIMAGIIVSVLTVPQAVAYALVAGLPISYGFIAFIYSALVASFFSSSRHVIIGPSNAIAILLQAGLASVLFTYHRDATGPERAQLSIQIVTQLALLIGGIQILAAFFKLGRLIQFVSHSVIIGYVSGVALALSIGQTFTLLGMPSPPAMVSSLYEKTVYIITHLNEAHWPTAAVGIGCLLLIALFSRTKSKVPAGIIMFGVVSLSAYFVYFFLLSGRYPMLEWPALNSMLNNISVVGDTHSESLWPTFQMPYFDPGIMNNLLPIAFAVALLGVMEATSTAKAIAANSGQRLSTNQEIFGLALGNLFSSFFGGMPVSGSPVRSSVNYNNGAKTRMAAILNSLFVAIIVFVFGFIIVHTPLAAFSALLIASAIKIVNYKQFFLCMKATSADAFVLLATLLSCVFFSLDIAFYIGVVMSITLYLKKAAIPQLIEFTVDEDGILHSVDHHKPQESRKIRLIKVEGELFFGAADVFQTTLKSIAEDDTTTRVIILQLKNARDIDATGCLALQQLYEYLKSSGRFLIGCGVTDPVWDVLSDAGIVELIGKSNLFIFDEKHPQLSMQRAFTRANDLINTIANVSEEKPEITEIVEVVQERT